MLKTMAFQISYSAQLCITANYFKCGSGGDKDYVISIVLHAVHALFSYYSSFSILRESMFAIIKFEEEVDFVNRHSKGLEGRMEIMNG